MADRLMVSRSYIDCCTIKRRVVLVEAFLVLCLMASNMYGINQSKLSLVITVFQIEFLLRFTRIRNHI